MTDYLIRCPNPSCELIYRPELTFPFGGDENKPPAEYCPQCGVNLEAAAKQQKGVVDE